MPRAPPRGDRTPATTMSWSWALSPGRGELACSHALQNACSGARQVQQKVRNRRRGRRGRGKSDSQFGNLEGTVRVEKAVAVVHLSGLAAGAEQVLHLLDGLRQPAQRIIAVSIQDSACGI